MSDEYVKIKKSDIGEIILSMERDWENLNSSQRMDILLLCDLVGLPQWKTVNAIILEENRLTWEQHRGVEPRSNK
jgi:hypothetical protein